MKQSRRQFVGTAAAAAGATILLPGAELLSPGVARAEFPAQASIDNDPLRPRYHLMPVRGWMNDPCAPVYFNERYHLFFQYNPGASVWGDMHWAHAVSKDMVHWTHRPVAMAPTPGGPDSYGVFTGTMVMNHNVPTVLYTCVSPSSAAEATLWGSNPPEREAQCVATPGSAGDTGADGALDVWNKLPAPVIARPPAGMKVTGFRDPVPWKEDDGMYYMLLASGEKGKGGNVLLYRSNDLRAWQFMHVFAQGKPTGQQTSDTVDSGEMWECPDFFPLGGKHVLIHSTGTLEGRKTMWQSGTLDKRTMRWTPEHEGLLNHGPYYAPKTQLDAEGNRILWGWIPETRPEAEFAKAGWAGCMSLPRVLTLVEGELRFAPASPVGSLRGAAVANVAGLQGAGLFQNEMVLRVTNSDGGPAHASIKDGVANAVLLVENGSGADGLKWNGKAVALLKPLARDVELRCFADHSVVEVFVGDALVLTHRVYGKESPARLTLPSGHRVVETKVFPLTAI